MSRLTKHQITSNVPLKNLNTFGVTSNAAYFLEITSLSQLESLKDEISEFSERLILGGGSNILFVNDYNGLVLYPQLKGIEILRETNSKVTLKVGASENWHVFVEHCVDKGFFGLENLALIPGTVGAAPVQNIGAYGVEIENLIIQVRCFDLEKGEFIELSNADCQFSYRDSFIKRAGQGKYLVTNVVFELSKIPSCNLTYKPLKDYFSGSRSSDNSNDKSVTPKQVFDRVCEIRSEKLPDPEILSNAGSFFKNPIISQAHYQKLKQKFEDLVAYPMLDGNEKVYKIAAGWLIDTAGFKGQTHDKVGVYSKQALVLVNYSDTDGANILALAQKIAARIIEIFDIELEPEVRIIN